MFPVSELPKLSVANRHQLPNCIAVYFVLSPEGNVLYVGQTTSLSYRWRYRQHHVITKVSDSDQIAWMEVEADSAKAKESEFIRMFRPPLNGQIGDKTARLPDVRLTSSELRQLLRDAEIVGETPSDFIRKALEEKVNRLASRCPELVRDAAN